MKKLKNYVGVNDTKELVIRIKVGITKQLKVDGVISDADCQKLVRTLEQEYAKIKATNGIESGWSLC